MSALRQYENGGSSSARCILDQEKLDDLTNAIKGLSITVDTLNHNHREMTRWLLVVVCVIALGKEIISIGNRLIGSFKAEISEVAQR